MSNISELLVSAHCNRVNGRKNMELIGVNCFCANAKNFGNPAAVVFDFHGDDLSKQRLAREWIDHALLKQL